MSSLVFLLPLVTAAAGALLLRGSANREVAGMIAGLVVGIVLAMVLSRLIRPRSTD